LLSSDNFLFIGIFFVFLFLNKSFHAFSKGLDLLFESILFGIELFELFGSFSKGSFEFLVFPGNIKVFTIRFGAFLFEFQIFFIELVDFAFEFF
jgi:hypothetical protein